MEDFGKTFNRTAKGWSAQQIECSLGANILWPGDEAVFTFFLKRGQRYKGTLKAEVIRYGTEGKPGNWWRPIVFKLAETSVSSVEIDLPAGEGTRPRIGDAFGGYAVILELGDNDWSTHWVNEVEFDWER